MSKLAALLGWAPTPDQSGSMLHHDALPQGLSNDEAWYKESVVMDALNRDDAALMSGLRRACWGSGDPTASVS